MSADHEFILIASLSAAVPLWINEFRLYTEDGRRWMLENIGGHSHDNDTEDSYNCRTLADVIAAHGDELQYGGRHRPEAFNALAKALALAAFAHGGVTFCGIHWCAGSGHMGVPHAGGMCAEELQRKPVTA